MLRLRIWNFILIYLTGFGLQSTWTANLDHKYKILLDLDLEILELWDYD